MGNTLKESWGRYLAFTLVTLHTVFWVQGLLLHLADPNREHLLPFVVLLFMDFPFTFPVMAVCMAAPVPHVPFGVWFTLWLIAGTWLQWAWPRALNRYLDKKSA